MAVENLIETRLKDPKKDLYDKANDKYGYTGIQSFVLVDAYDNLIFYAATKYEAVFYYAYKCKNTEEDIREVCEKIKDITEESPCYDLFWRDFSELKNQHDAGFFYKLEGEQYYSYSTLNDELERIQRKIEFLNYDNALEKSLELVLKGRKYGFEPNAFFNPNANDEKWEIEKSLRKIDFLDDFDFLILSKNEKIRKLYESYLSGLSEFNVSCLAAGK